VPQQFKIRLVQQVGDVVLLAGKKVVYTDDIVTVADEPIAKMRSKESSAARYEDSFDFGHNPLLIAELVLFAEDPRIDDISSDNPPQPGVCTMASRIRARINPRRTGAPYESSVAKAVNSTLFARVRLSVIIRPKGRIAWKPRLQYRARMRKRLFLQ